MKVSISPDPLNHFPHISAEQLGEVCGIIPHWVLEYTQSNHTMSLVDYLSLVYGFPVHEMKGVTLTPEGIFQFPGDPDQYPLVKITLDNATFYQYQFAMIAVVTPTSTFVTRMD